MVDPIKKFYRMNNSKEIYFMWVIPITVVCISLIVGMIPFIQFKVSVNDFTADILGDYITIMTLFVSFTMGYLSILMTSGSDNVNELKARDSKYFIDENGKPYKLFQIIMTGITYAVIVEICFLIMAVMENYFITCLSSSVLKLLCAIDAGIFAHIVIILLIIIKNIYYIFWKPEDGD